jgi:hypothetical protein
MLFQIVMMVALRAWLPCADGMDRAVPFRNGK